MNPSIGRIVHYYNGEGQGPHAALIINVHSETCVDLQVFPQDGERPSPATSVVDTEGDSKGRWAWPPRV